MAKAGPRAGTQRRQQSADVRAALVSAAIDALRETGYAGASAREIAGRAGCSQALVFYHFGSVTDRLQPWRELTEQAVRSALRQSAAARLLPPAEAARALVAGFLGLELLASLDNNRAAALALLDRAASLARLLDMLAGIKLPGR